jgi:hypothetical protein
MANVLCQVQGSKRLLIFPPSDVTKFRFEPGASSSDINILDELSGGMPAGVNPHEAILNPGDVLFLPPFWLHTASPTSGMHCLNLPIQRRVFLCRGILPYSMTNNVMVRIKHCSERLFPQFPLALLRWEGRLWE